eukprot:c16550_g1_i1.p3 GENE.c16550_g1_i1~~c16550_g1_i1.p3  ORF type:complete len:111 (+),score=7.42 c16550_g1_i1:314-646(+)
MLPVGRTENSVKNRYGALSRQRLNPPNPDPATPETPHSHVSPCAVRSTPNLHEDSDGGGAPPLSLVDTPSEPAEKQPEVELTTTLTTRMVSGSIFLAQFLPWGFLESDFF